jgi:lipoate---protein ligase
LRTTSDPPAGGGPDAPRASLWSASIAADEIACHDLTLPRVEANLALDEAMLIEADEGRAPPLVRFWEPRDYAVVLGASRRLRDEVFIDACRADGVPVFRRSSGGGTVLIGPGTLNVTVILPETAAPGLSAVDAAHRHVMDGLARSIRRAGAPVDVQGLGDLVLGDRKCAGSAQRRLKRWFLVHCSILYQFPIDRIARYLALPARQPDYRRGRPHAEFLRNLDLPRATLVEALHPGGPAPCADSTGTTSLQGAMALLPSLLAERFANPEWIERF